MTSSYSKKQNIDLSLFKEKIKLSDKQPIDTEAYRMDGNHTNNIQRMAKYVDLGTPSCCDYLYVKNTKAIIIEDTLLGACLKRLKEQLNITSINNNPRSSNDNKIIYLKNLLNYEQCLKVYGSFIILCYLRRQYTKIAKQLDDKEFIFWFVINDEDDIPAIDNIGAVDFFKEHFQKKIQSSLDGQVRGAKLVTKVKILLLTQFLKELNKIKQSS